MRTSKRRSIRRRRIAAALLFVLVAAGSTASGAAVVLASRGSAHPAAAPSAQSPARTVVVSCPSPSLRGRIPAMVTLPAGYANTAERLPTIYFLHGLPADPDSYLGNRFVASELASAGRRAIVVAPQGARAPDSDREYLDWNDGDDWPTAITHDLVTCVDRRFRTIRARTGRALIGLSAGGYGAFNIGLRNLSVFGAVESWSGYFAATNPAGTALLTLDSPAAASAAVAPAGAGLARTLVSWPTFIGFYVGDGDSRFAAMNRQYNSELDRSGVPHVFSMYTGGHTYALWEAQAPAWLAMALDALNAEARAHRHA